MSELPSPCGSWRFTVRRLGTARGRTDEIVVFARIEAGGAMTVIAGEPRIAGWRSAGPRRVVLVADWYVRAGQTRIFVQAAVELSADGMTCQGRLQCRYVDLASAIHAPTVTGEVDGTRSTAF